MTARVGLALPAGSHQFPSDWPAPMLAAPIHNPVSLPSANQDPATSIDSGGL